MVGSLFIVARRCEGWSNSEYSNVIVLSVGLMSSHVHVQYLYHVVVRYLSILILRGDLLITRLDRSPLLGLCELNRNVLLPFTVHSSLHRHYYCNKMLYACIPNWHFGTREISQLLYWIEPNQTVRSQNHQDSRNSPSVHLRRYPLYRYINLPRTYLNNNWQL